MPFPRRQQPQYLLEWRSQVPHTNHHSWKVGWCYIALRGRVKLIWDQSRPGRRETLNAVGVAAFSAGVSAYTHLPECFILHMLYYLLSMLKRKNCICQEHNISTLITQCAMHKTSCMYKQFWRGVFFPVKEVQQRQHVDLEGCHMCF